MFNVDKQKPRWTEWSQQKPFRLESKRRQIKNFEASHRKSWENCKHIERTEKRNSFTAQSEWVRKDHWKHVGRKIVWSVSRHCQIVRRFARRRMVGKDEAVLENEMGSLIPIFWKDFPGNLYIIFIICRWKMYFGFKTNMIKINLIR
jgi:hypothetical protein